MTLPLLPIGGDWQNQLAFWSPGTNSTKTPQTVWIYYGGAWFDPSVYTPNSPVKDFYSGYHIDLNGSSTSDTGVYVNSSKVTALLIAPDYRWIEGWDNDSNRIEAPLTRYFDGDDLISGRNSRTQVFSGPGDDTLYLNGGNDWGLGGDGDDVIHGGAGNDLIYGDWTNVPVYVDPAYGPNTDQFLSNASHANRLIWSFEIPAEESPARTKHFDEDGNLVDGEPVGDDLLFGDQGSDTLYGGPGNDQLDGGPRGSGWTDVLYGGDGADMFYLNYEIESEGEEEPEKWWVEWGDAAVGEAGAKSTDEIVEVLAEAAAEEFFETMVGGVLLSGVAGAIGSTVASGIEALFKKSKPEAPPITSEDVMVVADFDPRVDALFLPTEEGKTLTADARYFASSAGGLTGWGATFSTIDGVYAEVFLSQDFLDEFGVSNNTPGAEAFIENLFSAAMVVNEDGQSDENEAYPFQNLTAADYTDGVVPEYADTTPLALATPEGTEATIFGAIAPLKVFGPAVNNAVAMVAGTNMGDILSVNTKGFVPSDYRTAAVQLYEGTSLVKGFGGNDIIFGGAGQDILHGGDGDDDLYSFQTAITSSGPLRESLYGENGNDTLYTGGTAADLYGGSGTDIVSFSISPYAVTASLADASGADIGHPDNTYNFSGVENLEGSAQADVLTGDANNNVISGLGGDDALTGMGGNDTIIGGDGYDTVRYASGTAGGILVDLAHNFGDGRGSVGLWLDAYGGSDTVDRATVEAYVGTADDDHFEGDGGNGTNALYSADFFGLGGDDTLIGSGLAQTLNGGDGDDALTGMGGNDTIIGGDGYDTVRYASGTAGGILVDLAHNFGDGRGSVGLWLDAYGGSDTVDRATVEAYVGTADDDHFEGDSGNSTNALYAADFFGQGGDDTLIGSGLAQTLNGGDGDDALTGMGGNDTIIGGDGYDTMRFASGTAGGILVDLAHNFGDGRGSVGLWLDAYGGSDTVDRATVEAYVGTPDDDHFEGDGGNSTNALYSADFFGQGGDDTLIGSGLAQTLNGGDGDDALTGMGGNDTIIGGDGYDTMRFASGTAGGILVDLAHNFGDGRGSVGLWLDAYGGSDTVDRATVEAYVGTPDDDHFEGDGGNSTNALYSADFFGQGGNDTLIGSGLAQTLDGGDGDDVLQGMGGADTLTGGDGSDIFAGTPTDIDGDVIEDFTVDDVLRVLNPGTYPTSYAFRVNVVENTATQTVLAITEADGKTVLAELTLEGSFNGRFNGHYFKVTNGSTYTDITYSPPTGTTITGSTGADQLSGTIGNDFMHGGKGADWISGGEGDDIAIGGKGADFIRGEDGNDLLRGGKGVDSIFGGDGNDVASGGDGTDWIFGGDGNDVASGGKGADFVRGGDGDDLLRGGKGADWISGGEGDDIANGGKGADFIRGGNGDDLLRGGKGADRIFGGDGDDMIFGGEGADRIVGHSGANDLWGGAGADVFVFEAGQDLSIVHDFEVGHDKVEILAAGRAVQVDLAIAPGSTTVLLDGVGPIVLLDGVTATFDDFMIV